MGSYGLIKKELIKKKDEFQSVLKKGMRLETDLLKAYFLKNNLSYSRVGISYVKKIGIKTAAQRNRIKRIIKEAYRKNKALLMPGFDIILIAKFINKKTLSTQIEDDLKTLFQRIE